MRAIPAASCQWVSYYANRFAAIPLGYRIRMQSDMNDLLPVRGNDATEILISDHEVIKRFLSELTQSSAGEGLKMTLDQLKGVLTIHNATEENIVYPALRQVAHKKWEAQRLYHETAEADVLVFQLDTMMKEGNYADFPRIAEKLRDAVLEHIEDEEQKAFPHLQDSAEPMQAQMLTQSVREFRGIIRINMGIGQARAEFGEISQQTGQRTPAG
jgi:hemerythrin superfamily protein